MRVRTGAHSCRHCRPQANRAPSLSLTGPCLLGGSSGTHPTWEQWSAWRSVQTWSRPVTELFLCQCPVLSLQDAVKGLFVCCVFLDYVSLSQRFIPELINFLLGILYIATPNKQSQGELVGGSFFKCVVLENFLRLLEGIHPRGKVGRWESGEKTNVCSPPTRVASLSLRVDEDTPHSEGIRPEAACGVVTSQVHQRAAENTVSPCSFCCC